MRAVRFDVATRVAKTIERARSTAIHTAPTYEAPTAGNAYETRRATLGGASRYSRMTELIHGRETASCRLTPEIDAKAIATVAERAQNLSLTLLEA